MSKNILLATVLGAVATFGVAQAATTAKPADVVAAPAAKAAPAASAIKPAHMKKKHHKAMAKPAAKAS